MNCQCKNLVEFTLNNPDTGDYVKNKVYQCQDCQKCYILAEINFE